MKPVIIARLTRITACCVKQHVHDPQPFLQWNGPNPTIDLESSCILTLQKRPIVWRGFYDRVHGELYVQPLRNCESYGRWVWVVSMAGKEHDVFDYWNIAVVHALYAFRNPVVMRNKAGAR